ncbi:MAG TPA: erythromycin esterase family protein, partial [Pirellulales bacterium]|nr:erythromycin esterase family protein [Pirellulales bacterium]
MSRHRKRIGFGEPDVSTRLVEAVASHATTLHGWEDLDPLLERIGTARYVLLGEASHGTAEYYDWRRAISQRLIREKGFSFIAVEGDWPDCYRVTRYVKGFDGSAQTGREAAHAFRRWPTWMWANDEAVSLLEWLRQQNVRLPETRRVGFYGLDVYSLWDSMHAVLEYLEHTDGNAATAARRAFECFEPYGEDVQEYARATLWVPTSCEDEVVDMLRALRSQRPRGTPADREEFFDAEQNALVAANAEKYYRAMVRGDAESWNVRDTHMAETLDRLMAHHGADAKAIVWAHNTHIGDARHTDMAASGMVNIGQLVRERHAAEGVVLVGFSSHRGSVIAGEAWDAPMRSITVPPAREASWEDVLHRAGGDDKLLIFDKLDPSQDREMFDERGHRAIGVVYRPEIESFGNYVP